MINEQYIYKIQVVRTTENYYKCFEEGYAYYEHPEDLEKIMTNCYINGDWLSIQEYYNVISIVYTPSIKTFTFHVTGRKDKCLECDCYNINEQKCNVNNICLKGGD